MNSDLNEITRKLSNIRKKATAALDTEMNLFDEADYIHLFNNFARVRSILKSTSPKAFEEIPDREVKKESFDFGKEYISQRSFSFLIEDLNDCLSIIESLGNSPDALLNNQSKKIPEHIRRDIFDSLRVGKVAWSGRLDEIEFLSRIYNLDSLPSFDGRFANAKKDIYQHRVNNDDWSDDWIYNDERFELLRGSDVLLLQFLCAMVHPIVRDDVESISLVKLFNHHLEPCGWMICEQSTVGGKPVFAANRNYVSFSQQTLSSVKEELNTEYLTKIIHRMQSSIDSDPELAIGTAKDFVESVCKTILNQKNIQFGKADSLPQLAKKTLEALQLEPDKMPAETKALETIRSLLKSLANIVQNMAELRRDFGSGHGKDAKVKGLGPRHARLAVGAASTLAVFMFETNLERQTKSTDGVKG